jgi:hypothetical protein
VVRGSYSLEDAENPAAKEWYSNTAIGKYLHVNQRLIDTVATPSTSKQLFAMPACHNAR